MLINTVNFYTDYNYRLVKNNIYGTVTNKNTYLKELIVKSLQKRVITFDNTSENIQYLLIYNNNIQLFNDFYNLASTNLIKILYYNSFFFLQKQKNSLKQTIRVFLFLRFNFFYNFKKKVYNNILKKNKRKKNFYFFDKLKIVYQRNILPFKYFKNFLDKIVADKSFFFGSVFRHLSKNRLKKFKATQVFNFFFFFKFFFFRKIFWKILFLQKKNIFFFADKHSLPIKFKKSKQFLNLDIESLLCIDYTYSQMLLDLFLFRYYYSLCLKKK